MTDAQRPLEHDAEALVDPRVRTLLERYAAQVGAGVREVEEYLLEFEVPASEGRFFDRSERGLVHEPIRIAFSLDILERYPEAEMAVVGSDLFDRLVHAIQARGHRVRRGLIPSTHDAAADPATLGLPFVDVSVGSPTTTTARHRIGRLLARVMLRAGTDAEEHLVESAPFDLVTGRPLPSAIADACAEAAPEAPDESHPDPAPVKPYPDLVSLMLDDLRERLQPRIVGLREEARGALAEEIGRINRYYTGLIGDDASQTERAVVEREWERRRTEEERRHAVRGSVHPVQLQEWELMVQAAAWPLVTASGHRGEFRADRPLAGDGGWTTACPTCGAAPPAIHVCVEDHVSCGACSARCAVCGDWFCRDHGIATCSVEPHPTCIDHTRTCVACEGEYCTEHEAVCAVGDHVACATCVAECAVCGRSVCSRHATETAAEAPRGRRRLCPDCVVHCEGGQSEPVGRDEATPCASCERFVCERHQTRCAVDGLVHCSEHLRRSDHTRRLVCETHRSPCDEEPGAVIASDEVDDCVACGKRVCDRHGALCAGHGQHFCLTHLKPLLDTQGEMGCEEHRSVCHVDDRTYSLAGTSACPVCTRATCRDHLIACLSCGRRVCTQDIDSGRICQTCHRLELVSDPDDDVITAAIAANDGEPVKARSWRVNQDASHRVVEVDLGWTRRLVFTVAHELAEPSTVVRRSVFGSRRIHG